MLDFQNCEALLTLLWRLATQEQSFYVINTLLVPRLQCREQSDPRNTEVRHLSDGNDHEEKYENS